MKSKSLFLLKDILYYLTYFFPLAFSMAVLSGFGAGIGILFSVVAIILFPKLNSNKVMPLLISFLILCKNPDVALSSSIICGFLLMISSYYYDKIKKLIICPVVSGIMLSGALTITVLFTTDYFGIGATGNNVTEMIKSYVSLGFHPNWRGVLYGTIVLVLMITIPRKFKASSKYLSSSFIALVFTLILNLFLNPSHMISAINEIEYTDLSMIKDYFDLRLNLLFNFKTFLIAFTLFIIYFYSITIFDNPEKKDYIYSGISNVFSSGLIGMPLPYGVNKNYRDLFARVIAAMLVLISFLLLKDYFLRIPLHSCAVVIIVSAWDSVKWKEIKNAFGKISGSLFFAISFVLCLLTDMPFGITVSTFAFALISIIFQNKKTCK